MLSEMKIFSKYDTEYLFQTNAKIYIMVAAVNHHLKNLFFVIIVR